MKANNIKINNARGGRMLNHRSRETAFRTKSEQGQVFVVKKGFPILLDVDPVDPYFLRSGEAPVMVQNFENWF